MKKLSLKEDLGVEGKIFCISMQRNGTSSVGDFLEQYGLVRLGSPHSNKSRWPLSWFSGDFNAIFEAPSFLSAEVLEDDPWWFPEFYKYLYHKFPGSKFILLNRDPNAWFRSMIKHSNGYSMGLTDLHAKLYRREEELHWLKENIKDFGSERVRELILYDKPQHYISVYEQHNREVQDFFHRMSPDSLFSCDLADKELWKKLAKWLRLPKYKNVSNDVHAHKSKGEFTQQHLLYQRSSWKK